MNGREYGRDVEMNDERKKEEEREWESQEGKKREKKCKDAKGIKNARLEMEVIRKVKKKKDKWTVIQKKA